MGPESLKNASFDPLGYRDHTGSVVLLLLWHDLRREAESLAQVVSAVGYDEQVEAVLTDPTYYLLVAHLESPVWT